MGRIAFVFSGQGDQHPGMGKELYEKYAAARKVFDTCDSLRPGTSEMCFSGTAEELKETANTQPCMFAFELAAAAVLIENGIRPDAAAGFSRLIQSGQLVKEYVLLCHGSPPTQEGDMEDLLWKDPRKNKVYVVDRVRGGVRSASLSYRVLAALSGDRTLVRVRLKTGRSHQIRVQFASRRCPLWGDHKYGARDDGKEPMLFSCALSFPWEGKEYHFEYLPEWAGTGS